MATVSSFFSRENAEKLSEAMEIPDEYFTIFSNSVYSVFGPASDALENTIATAMPTMYKQVNAYVDASIHPFAKKLPLMNPWQVVFAVLSYLAALMVLYVVGKILGKGKYRLLGMTHNLMLHLLSLYMSVGLIIGARAAGYSLWNNGVGTGKVDWRIAKLLWIFYASKIPEFVDTFLMLLKHNYRQVTFLHLYHHMSVFVIWFVTVMKAPGGEAYYSAMVNSGIHVIMYGYYFLTMMFEQGAVRKFLSNFKFIITKGQMTQFALNCVQSVYDLFVVPRHALKYDAGLLHILFIYMITLLFLFGNFLRKNQGKKVADPLNPSMPSHSPSPVSRGHGATRMSGTPAFNDSPQKNGKATNGNQAQPTKRTESRRSKKE